jgi:PAS domain S-box-containing protein
MPHLKTSPNGTTCTAAQKKNVFDKNPVVNGHLRLGNTMTDTPSEQAETLREKAEALLQITPAAAEALSTEAGKQLLHELQVHQIELELQNEELRKSQIALEESRGRYMHLYHNAPVGYVVLNRAGIIVQDNATFAGMVGHDYRQLHGKPFADFLVPEDQPIFRARLKAFFKHPDDKHIEVRLGTAGKTSLNVDLAAAVQHSNHQGQQPQDNELLVTVTDITARVKAEEALQRSHKFILDVIDSLSAHICVLDGDGEIIAVNKAWRRFSTTNRPIAGNLAEGANYLAICDNAKGDDANFAATFAAGIRAVLQGQSDMFSLEYPCHSEDEQRWFMGRVTRLSEDVHGQVVVAHENISEQKLLEKEKLQLQTQINQLEKAESLGRMAGAIAHNFNNALAAVLGNLEMALEDISGDEPSRILKAALQAAWRASEMSGLMLTYLGQTVEQQEPVDLSMVCRQVLPLLMLAKPHGIEITTDFPMPGQIVRASAKQIQQIFSSLMANAWEAMENKPGWVRVTINTVVPQEISTKHRYPLDYQIQDSAYTCLLVQDSGVGIADRDLDNLFDPFFTSKFAGRGMGLSVVLGILRAHRGAITVESHPGRGSIFRVYLPNLPKQR